MRPGPHRGYRRVRPQLGCGSAQSEQPTSETKLPGTLAKLAAFGASLKLVRAYPQVSDGTGYSTDKEAPMTDDGARFGDPRLPAETITSQSHLFPLGAQPPANGRKGGRPRKVDDATAAKARQLREKGIAASDIAKMLGVSRATVYRYLADDAAA
jgi:hypothetical protein